MTKKRVSGVFTAAIVAGLAFSPVSAFAIDRASVAAQVLSACSSGGPQCFATINALLASATGVSASIIAQGIADATKAISNTNQALAIKIAGLVAKNGSAAVQVAYGSVLDGTGTASVGSPLSGVLRSGETTERGNGETPGSDDHPLVGSAG